LLEPGAKIEVLNYCPDCITCITDLGAHIDCEFGLQHHSEFSFFSQATKLLGIIPTFASTVSFSATESSDNKFCFDQI
jgi:hypothetical protein